MPQVYCPSPPEPAPTYSGKRSKGGKRSLEQEEQDIAAKVEDEEAQRRLADDGYYGGYGYSYDDAYWGGIGGPGYGPGYGPGCYVVGCLQWCAAPGPAPVGKGGSKGGKRGLEAKEEMP